MKDEYRRRRKAEHRLIKTLEEADSNGALTPVHREYLEVDRPNFVNVSAQGNEYVATTTSNWWIRVYALEKKDNIVPFDPFLISEKMEKALLPNRTRKPAWFSAPHCTRDDRDSVQFIALDVIGCVKLEIPGYVSTWCVASGQCLESIVLRGVRFDSGVCRISETEFVVGSEEGHLCFLSHEKGCNLREQGVYGRRTIRAFGRWQQTRTPLLPLPPTGRCGCGTQKRSGGWRYFITTKSSIAPQYPTSIS